MPPLAMPVSSIEPSGAMPVLIQASQVFQASTHISAVTEAALVVITAGADIEAGMAGVVIAAGEAGADMEVGASILPVQPGLPAMDHSMKWAGPISIKAVPAKLLATITRLPRPIPALREIIIPRTALRSACRSNLILLRTTTGVSPAVLYPKISTKCPGKGFTPSLRHSSSVCPARFRDS